MSSNSVNRETLRDALAVLLNTALVTTLLSVHTVYNHLVSDFKGRSPVVVVTSAGGERSKIAQVLVGHSKVLLDVHTFVLYALADGTWTEQQAEDRLDLIEKQINDTLVDNYVYTGYWQSIDYERPSVVDPVPVKVGGDVYRHETIYLIVHTQDT